MRATFLYNRSMELPKQLAQEIADMERKLAEKKALLDQDTSGMEKSSDKELFHDVVAEKIQATNPAESYKPAVPPVSSSGSSGHQQPQASYMSPDLQPRVQELVKIVFQSSLEEAIIQAKATNDAALIDAFHDMIVDELYPHLVETQKVEQVL